MDTNTDITCDYRGPGSTGATVILLVIGIPHLIIGLSMLFLAYNELVMLICGVTFTCSGTLLLAIATYLLAIRGRRRLVADPQGITYFGSMGRPISAPWAEVVVEDQRQGRSRLVFHLPQRDVTLGMTARGSHDLVSYLEERGLLAVYDDPDLDDAFGHDDIEAEEVTRLI